MPAIYTIFLRLGSSRRSNNLPRPLNFSRGDCEIGYNFGKEIICAAAGSFSTADFQQRFQGRLLWGLAHAIVMDLCKLLPEQYTAEPRVHLGKNFDVDVCTFEVDGGNRFESDASESGTATATWAPPEPTLTLELDPTEIYGCEVLIFDQQCGRELVAAIELVSPENKDRPETRQAFVSKWRPCCREKSAYRLSIW